MKEGLVAFNLRQFSNFPLRTPPIFIRLQLTLYSGHQFREIYLMELQIRSSQSGEIQ